VLVKRVRLGCCPLSSAQRNCTGVVVRATGARGAGAFGCVTMAKPGEVAGEEEEEEELERSDTPGEKDAGKTKRQEEGTERYGGEEEEEKRGGGEEEEKSGGGEMEE